MVPYSTLKMRLGAVPVVVVKMPHPVHPLLHASGLSH